MELMLVLKSLETKSFAIFQNSKAKIRCAQYFIIITLTIVAITVEGFQFASVKKLIDHNFAGKNNLALGFYITVRSMGIVLKFFILCIFCYFLYVVFRLNNKARTQQRQRAWCEPKILILYSLITLYVLFSVNKILADCFELLCKSDLISKEFKSKALFYVTNQRLVISPTFEIMAAMAMIFIFYQQSFPRGNEVRTCRTTSI